MAELDHLVAEAEHSGLGAAATSFIQETLALVLGGTGGLAGLIDRLHGAGLGERVTAWFAGSAGHTLTGPEVEKVFESGTIAGLAHRVGLAREQASAALGRMLPRILTTLAPGGILSPSAMAEARDFAGAMPPPPAAASAPRTPGARPSAFAGMADLTPPPLRSTPRSAAPPPPRAPIVRGPTEQDPFRWALLTALAIALACAGWALKDPEPGPVVPPAHFQPLYPPPPAR